MADLIRRSDAIRLAEQGQIHGFLWQFEQLVKLPSAEPEIIYCKDCDQYNPEAQFCDLVQFNFLPDGHCSWGRRKGRK